MSFSYCTVFYLKNDSLLRILRFPLAISNFFFHFLWDLEIAGLNCTLKYSTCHWYLQGIHTSFSHDDIENTVANIINATYARCVMGRLYIILSNIQRLSFILIDL